MATFEVAKALIDKHFQHKKWLSQLPSDWTGPYPLPATIIDYYATVGPVDVSIRNYGNDLFFPSLMRLWERQEGYGYNSITRELLEDWDDDWIVIADVGAEPFIFSKATGHVFFAHHGEGEWRLTLLFDDLEEMVTCLLIMGSVTTIAGNDFTNTDSFIKRQYYLETLHQLAEVLSSPSKASNLLTQLDWVTEVPLR